MSYALDMIKSECLTKFLKAFGTLNLASEEVRNVN
jgi:hypothetical protein